MVKQKAQIWALRGKSKVNQFEFSLVSTFIIHFGTFVECSSRVRSFMWFSGGLGPNFPNNPKCRLINQVESKIGIISKHHEDKINQAIRAKQTFANEEEQKILSSGSTVLNQNKEANL